MRAKISVRGFPDKRNREINPLWLQRILDVNEEVFRTLL